MTRKMSSMPAAVATPTTGERCVRASGQEIRGADVEEESAEEREYPWQSLRREREEKRAGHAQHRSRHVDEQPHDRASYGVAVRENNRHGVQSVTEVVSDDRQRDQQADLRVRLKADSDRDTIEEAVDT